MQTDSQNLSASLEDYLEAISNIADDSAVARVKDIAEFLGVTKSSVTGALRLLSEKGLINYKPYDFVTLTDIGRTVAIRIVKKHNILKSFFINILGIEAKVAHQAACKAEHVLGPVVIAKILYFVEFVTQQNKDGYDLVEKFGLFCQNKPASISTINTANKDIANTIGLNKLKPKQ